MVIDNEGTRLQAMTFNGTIPGPAIVVHEGDYVEVTLVNLATNHAAQHRFPRRHRRAERRRLDADQPPGRGGDPLEGDAHRRLRLSLHSGRDMIPWHVASGMSGIVMVLPRDGLKDGQGKPLHYDSVYYIGENDFYVPRDKDGKFKRYGSPADPFADTLELMKKLIPSHVVFEGRVDSLTGDHAMPAKVGEMVLMLHSQAIAIRASISPRRLRLGDGQVLQSARDRPRDLARPRRLGRRRALYLT